MYLRRCSLRSRTRALPHRRLHDDVAFDSTPRGWFVLPSEEFLLLLLYIVLTERLIKSKENSKRINENITKQLIHWEHSPKHFQRWAHVKTIIAYSPATRVLHIPKYITVTNETFGCITTVTYAKWVMDGIWQLTSHPFIYQSLSCVGPICRSHQHIYLFIM